MFIEYINVVLLIIVVTSLCAIYSIKYILIYRLKRDDSIALILLFKYMSKITQIYNNILA